MSRKLDLDLRDHAAVKGVTLRALNDPLFVPRRTTLAPDRESRAMTAASTCRGAGGTAPRHQMA